MARKKKSAVFTEDSILAVRLSKLFADETLSVTGEKLGVSSQAVSFWKQGQSIPSVDMLAQISRLYDVSVDYLLGLSDAETLSEDMQNAEAITGLSKKAIETIKSIPLTTASEGNNVDIFFRAPYPALEAFFAHFDMVIDDYQRMRDCCEFCDALSIDDILKYRKLAGKERTAFDDDFYREHRYGFPDDIDCFGLFDDEAELGRYKLQKALENLIDKTVNIEALVADCVRNKDKLSRLYAEADNADSPKQRRHEEQIDMFSLKEGEADNKA